MSDNIHPSDATSAAGSLCKQAAAWKTAENQVLICSTSEPADTNESTSSAKQETTTSQVVHQCSFTLLSSGENRHQPLYAHSHYLSHETQPEACASLRKSCEEATKIICAFPSAQQKVIQSVVNPSDAVTISSKDVTSFLGLQALCNMHLWTCLSTLLPLKVENIWLLANDNLQPLTAFLDGLTRIIKTEDLQASRSFAGVLRRTRLWRIYQPQKTATDPAGETADTSRPRAQTDLINYQTRPGRPGHQHSLSYDPSLVPRSESSAN